MQFEGHGAVFGNVDLGGDVILPGAFKRTLAEHKANGSLPAMFWMHNPDRVPGKWLEVAEDDKGLAVKGELAQTDLGKEIHILLKWRPCAASRSATSRLMSITPPTECGF
jgi:HK97 family phage prohead protease